MESSSFSILFCSFIYSYVFVAESILFYIIYININTATMSVILDFALLFLYDFHSKVFAFVVHSSSLLICPNCYRYRSDETLRTSSPLHLKEFECEHVCVSLTQSCTREKKILVYLIYVLFTILRLFDSVLYFPYLSTLHAAAALLFPIHRLHTLRI